MEGVDYSFSRPSPLLLKAAGKQFAIRYISGYGKALTSDEKAVLFRAGLGIGLVFESTGGRAMAGYVAGAQDAAISLSVSNSLGLKGIPIFFAVDFDATPAQKPHIAAYLTGAASVLGKNRVGVYGSYYVVKYMSEQHICGYFWQTYAWSGGLVWKAKTLARAALGKVKHPSAQLYQYRNGVTIAGGQVDLCRTLTPEAGIMFPHSPTPQPKPKPVPLPRPRKGGHWSITVTPETGGYLNFNSKTIIGWAIRHPRIMQRGWRRIDAQWIETG